MQNKDAVVYIVDDDRAVALYMKALLTNAGIDSQVFNSPADFVRCVPHCREGCVVLDMQMQEMDGLAVQASLNTSASHMPIIFLTGEASVGEAVSAVKAGAFEFFEKPIDPRQFIDCVNRAIERSRVLREAAIDNVALNHRIDKLTPREREIALQIASGSANKMVAMQLKISQRTVETHRARIMAKLEVENVVELVKALAGQTEAQTLANSLFVSSAA